MPPASNLSSYPEAPFVGRQRELVLLSSGLERAKRGITASFLITGPSGVGKSRLALEFAARATEAGSTAIRMLLSSAVEADTFVVIGNRGSNSIGTGDSVTCAPAESSDLPNLGTFGRVARALLQDQPVAPILIFDDLQDLDVDGLRTLPLLVHTIACLSPLVIGIYRTVDLTARKELAKLLRRPIFRESARINLREFNSDEIYELVRNRVNGRFNAAALDSVVTATGGNPRMLDNAVNLGLLEEPLNTVRGVRGFELEIEPHIEVLSESARQMLGVASVIGLEFDLSILARVADMAAEQLLDGIKEGDIGGIITPNKRPGRFTFQHALVRDGLYESLSGAERARLHRRVGEAFEDIRREDDAFLGDIASHFYEAALFAGDHKAAEYCVRAAEQASLAGELGQSDRFCEMAQVALELPGSITEDQRRELRERVDQLRGRMIIALDAPNAGVNSSAGVSISEEAVDSSDHSDSNRLVLELDAIESAKPPDPQHVSNDAPKSFRKEGEYWTIVFEQKTLRLRDSLGAACIARLLESPRRLFLALDLLTLVRGGLPMDVDVAERDADGTPQNIQGDLGARLDQTAKSAYRERLMELRQELDSARQFNDTGRVAMIEEEISAIARELASAIGLGKRDRRAGSDVERARVSATNAIRSVVRKVSPQHPSLARYLTTTIRTGSFCSYLPDPRFPGRWQT
jgi:hypothetical protein